MADRISFHHFMFIGWMLFLMLTNSVRSLKAKALKATYVNNIKSTVHYRFTVSKLYMILSYSDVNTVAQQLFNGQRQRFFSIIKPTVHITHTLLTVSVEHLHTVMRLQHQSKLSYSTLRSFFELLEFSRLTWDFRNLECTPVFTQKKRSS